MARAREGTGRPRLPAAITMLRRWARGRALVAFTLRYEYRWSSPASHLCIVIATLCNRLRVVGARRRGLTDGHAILCAGGKSLPIHTVPVNFTEKAHQLPVCRERLTEPANDPQANVRDGGLRAQVEDRVVVPRLVGGACSVCVSCWSSGWSGRARAVSIQLTLSQTVDRRCVSPPRDATAAWLQCVAVSVSCGSCRGGCECSELTFSQTGRYLVCRFNCDGLMG